MNRVFSLFSKIFIKPIVDLFFVKEVKGLGNIPKRNFILASNHQSHLDWIASAYPCVPRRFTYIGQVDKYTGPLALGRDLLYFIAGVIPVNREDKVSKKETMKKATKALERGDILILYPEGTRSRTGKIQRGKYGVARIHFKTGAPILPVAIKGTFKLLPPGGKLHIKRIVKINIGSPLYFKEEREAAKNLDCNSEKYKYFLRKVTEKLMEEITCLYRGI